MSDQWKQIERDLAKLIGGERLKFRFTDGDAESDFAVGEAKNRKTMTYRELEDWAVQIANRGNALNKLGVLYTKRKAGRGVQTPALVVMTADMFQQWFGDSDARSNQ